MGLMGLSFLGRRISGVSRSISESKRWLSSLVLAEHSAGSLNASTAQTVAAARCLDGPISVLVAGDDLGGVPEQAAKLEGVSAVLTASDPGLKHLLAAPTAALLVAMQKKRGFSHIFAAGSSVGRDVLPRAAAQLDVQAVAEAMEIKSPTTFVRPIYAGNALATVEASGQDVQVVTVRTTSFPPVGAGDGAAGVEAVSEEELAAARGAAAGQDWLSEEVAVSDRPQLSQAKVVVSGGRALKSAENFKMLEELADALGGAVGASRAAVDAGFVPNDLQVGQTGKVVAPDLYIAIGISGAIQHVAGIKDAKTIVAINSDAEAPIFEVANYGLVGDLFQIVPELQEKIKAAKAA